MRTILNFFIFVVILAVIGYKTCPDKQQHVEKISAVVNEAMQAEASERGELAGMAVEAISVTDIVSTTVDNLLTVDDYGFFSVGKVLWDEEEYRVSFGAMSCVFTFSSEMLQSKFSEIVQKAF